MYEKVNPQHPDKVADRIAGALVDLAYKKSESPKIAVEVLLGHGEATVMIETSENITSEEVDYIVSRIGGIQKTNSVIVPQDVHLAQNQSQELRCGDNGIFKGCVETSEQKKLTDIAHNIYDMYYHDGKYVIDASSSNVDVTICQSNMPESDNLKVFSMIANEFGVTKANINPLGEWDGGIDVDCGATNRKLGSDMGDAVTGGGLMGKDLSKADVSVNIVCHLLAQELWCTIYAKCSIGDEKVTFTYNGGSIEMPYSEIVSKAKQYIDEIGGFEKFAEWGLIR